MNSCQLLKLISILCSGSADLNITHPSSPLQSLEAGLEVESSQWGVIKMLGCELSMYLKISHIGNFDIPNDNVHFDYVSNMSSVLL